MEISFACFGSQGKKTKKGTSKGVISLAYVPGKYHCFFFNFKAIRVFQHVGNHGPLEI